MFAKGAVPKLLLGIVALAVTAAFSIPAGASNAQAQLKRKALSVTNMPTGWSVNNDAGSGALSDLTGCLHTLEANLPRAPEGDYSSRSRLPGR